ncbi:MBOAT family protein [Neochlamydia sp. AcF65]|uniref:MBOAT family O-acyltransferase n=1 Tax=Neochlamydia sp. AcF65 TaxID=2795735 RepID=UPI001BC97FF8|nr:MBOAT family protein [Neochlamydia sp. AcF65]
MLFNSYFFIFIYLPIVVAIFFVCCYFHLKKGAQLFLLISSLIFYAYWDVRFVPLLCASIFFNYIAGNQIYNASTSQLKKLYLLLSLTFNLALLLYFKYLNFFISSANYFLSSEVKLLDIILPLGISFFTFTQIAYLVDVYQARAVPGGWCSYSLFVTVFPHLIAGPVLHHKEMITQFDNPANYQWSSYNFAQGTFLFVIGLAKKVLIADAMYRYVTPVFDQNQTLIPFLQAWIGALAYSIELYFDFSGYSDMAVGLGLYFNIQLPLNFNSPYQATSMIDFWRRWHISLSNFLRDYLYIPLGGNRYGETRKLANLLITMLLGGAWHGANWTFVVWGLCHGFFLMINHLWRKLNVNLSPLLGQLLTFFCVVVAFAIFRSPDLPRAWMILKGLFGYNGIILPEKYEYSLAFLKAYGVAFERLHFSNVRLYDLLKILACLLAILLLPNSMWWKERFIRYPILAGLGLSALFIICLIDLDAVTEFLYYQF